MLKLKTLQSYKKNSQTKESFYFINLYKTESPRIFGCKQNFYKFNAECV